VTEFHEGVQIFPCFGVVCTEDLEIDLEFPVYMFCFSISLGVIHCASECFDSKTLHHFFEDVRVELGSSV